jgi:hypothetical protein
MVYKDNQSHTLAYGAHPPFFFPKKTYNLKAKVSYHTWPSLNLQDLNHKFLFYGSWHAFSQ